MSPGINTKKGRYTMKCEYGCEQNAKYQLKNGKWCCEKYSSRCPVIKRKNSDGLKKAYRDGRMNCSRFDGKRGWRKGKTVLSDERITSKFKGNLFVENSKAARSYIRRLLINENIIEYRCSECQLIEWNNKPLSLELEHRNGNGKDNRLENLTFLCPNCHSQTDTWRRKKNNAVMVELVDTLV